MTGCAIIIPTCDRPESVLRAVASALVALAEANAVGEVIVVDDGTVSARDQLLINGPVPNQKIVMNLGIKGPAAARNFGVQQTQQDLLFFLDDDDLMEPDYITRVLAKIRSGACQAGWGFCGRHAGDKNGMTNSSMQLDIETRLHKRLAATCLGFWIKRETFLMLGGFDNTLRINEDTDFCLTLANAGLMPWYNTKPGVRLNAARSTIETDKTSTTKITEAADRASAWQYIVEKHSALLLANPMEHKLFLAKIAKYRARSGDIRGALSLAFAQQGQTKWLSLAYTALGAATSKK